jgi:DNA-binding GntR family transcriptional regulator
MPDRATHRSLSRAVYAGIRADILAGRHAPGAKLSPRTIATEYNVSLSVVREALTRLTEQDLVVAAPQLGFSVVELDIEDVRDVSRLRILIEGAGLRGAVEHRGLMEAALDRDADRAVVLLTDHINKTATLLQSYLDSGAARDLAEPDAGPAAS